MNSNRSYIVLSDHYISCFTQVFSSISASSFLFSCWPKNICWKGSSTFSIVLCAMIPPQQQEQQFKNWIANNVETLTMWKGRDKIANRDKCPNFSTSRMPKDSLFSLYRLFFFRISHSSWQNSFPRLNILNTFWVHEIVLGWGSNPCTLRIFLPFFFSFFFSPLETEYRKVNIKCRFLLISNW